MNDHAAADDLVSDVFTKAIAANNTHSHISGYLFRIAHNLLIDYYRWRARRPDMSLDFAENVSQCGEPTLYDVAVALLDHARLEQAIRRLTALQAEVVRLRIEGYSFEEIAAIMDKYFGAVKAIYHRALVSLRRILAQGAPRA